MQLKELVDMTLKIRLENPDPEDDLAMLHMSDCQYGPKGEKLDEPGMMIVGLAVEGGGRQIETVARYMVAQCEPACMVLALPSWTASLPKGQTMADYGAKRVRELPPDMVYDSLVIQGEDTEGERIFRFYVLQRNEQAERVWEEQQGHDNVDSRFDKMFVLPHMLKDSTLEAAALDMTPEQAHDAAKRVLLAILKRAAKQAEEQR